MKSTPSKPSQQEAWAVNVVLAADRTKLFYDSVTVTGIGWKTGQEVHWPALL